MDLRSRSTVLIAAAAITFLAGLAAGHGVSSSPETESRDVGVADAPYASRTTRDESAVPPPTNGVTQTREGAVQAATSYGLALDGTLACLRVPGRRRRHGGLVP